MSTSARRLLSTTDLALIAAFAALVAACALLPAIDVAGPVPITLQTFGVLLAGAVLGARRGFLAVLLYLVLGAVGLPIFAGGTSGMSSFTGPSAGYLISFPFAAGLVGLLVGGARILLPRSTNPITSATGAPLVFVAAMVGVVLNHIVGIVGLHLRADLGWQAAWNIDKVFWLGDTLKAVAVGIVAAAVHRAFPALLGRRTRTAPGNGTTTATA
jgi:biotin transport system substrate-specific component